MISIVSHSDVYLELEVINLLLHIYRFIRIA